VGGLDDRPRVPAPICSATPTHAPHPRLHGRRGPFGLESPTPTEPPGRSVTLSRTGPPEGTLQPATVQNVKEENMQDGDTRRKTRRTGFASPTTWRMTRGCSPKQRRRGLCCRP
jgi:hypothetical protein